MDLLKHERFGRMNFQKRHRNLCVINMFICVSKKNKTLAGWENDDRIFFLG